MADPESTITQDNAPAAESNQAQAPAQVDDTTEKLNNLTLRIWPPTQRTRDAVVNRLIETLSSQSVLSKRYGTIPEEEASAVAKSIEEEAFSVAGASFSADDDGIEILQVYSKEISKRMLETVKARAAATAAPTATPTAAAPSGSADADSSNAGAAGGEDISSSSVKAEA